MTQQSDYCINLQAQSENLMQE